MWTRFDEGAVLRLSDGRQVTRMTLVLAPLSNQGASATTLPAGTVTRQLEASWTLLPDARTDNDPQVKRAAEGSLFIKEVSHWWDTRLGRQSKGRLACEVTCKAPPVDLVYKVSFRWHAAEPNATTRPSESITVLKDPVHFPKGVKARVNLEATDVRSLGASPPQWVDVVFTPWPEAAPPAVSVIGGGEVVIRAVPIWSRRY